MQFLFLCFALLVGFFCLAAVLFSNPDRITIFDRIALILSLVFIPVFFVLGLLQLFGVCPEVSVPFFGG